MVAVMQTDTPRSKVREQLFEGLYERAFPLVAKFVSHRKGTLQDAKDIFQDALVIYCEKLEDGGCIIQVSDEAYVLGICKHLWIRKHNRDRVTVSLDDFELSITIPEDYFPTIEEQKLVQLLSFTGRKCMELLKAFYYDKHPVSAIAATFGYRTLHSATVQKFKCLEKVRDTVKEKSITYEDFTE
jgi:DNA-directed RNA polymerase specialized sigma24 family protein